MGTVNRQCASGLQAVACIAAAIRSGEIDIGIGAGVESMTSNYGPAAMPTTVSDSVTAFPAAKDCLLPMGITSENVANEYKISREDQDRFALESHRRAAVAQEEGRFKREIVPVILPGGSAITKDEGVRRDTTLERLGSLRPAFGGATTAGNASQVSDGAAAVLLARRSTASALGLPILGRIVRFEVVGVAPRVMGIGPAVAIPRLLKNIGSGLRIEDVDVFEVNEAFASQSLMVMQKLRIPHEKLNPNGGAIALGHPLGCSGARLVATLLHDMQRRKKRVGVVSLCIGTGMGAAALIVNES